TTATAAGNYGSFFFPGDLSADGLHVAFRSYATNLAANDFNGDMDAFSFGTCSAAPSVTLAPVDTVVPVGGHATFQVGAIDTGRYQWQKDGVDIPGATLSYYTTPPVTAADAGTRYRVVLTGACGQQAAS